MLKKSIFIIAIIIISGLSGIVADRYVFPYLSSTKAFSKYDFLKKSLESTTVINKTEQVFVKEDASVNKITNAAASSVVNIISYSSPDLIGSKIKAAIPARNGTGTIATSDGLIMTYISAINTDAPGQKYKVTTSDGTAYDADLVGVDAYSNLAFMKISASNLPAISLANSDDASAGEKIITIGNSGSGYRNEFASGLLSNFNPTFNLSGKTISSSEKLEGVFNMDIANSNDFVGGPAIDWGSQAVGIIGQITIDNIPRYFIIPSNKVRTVLERALRNELSGVQAIGIYYLPVNKTLILSRNLKTEKGALVFSPSEQQGLAVIANSPAAKAGIKLNDIITKVADEEINDTHSFSDLLYKHKKRETIELTVVRDGNEQKIAVQL